MATVAEIVNSERFKALVKQRWTVSIVLTVLLFVLYYGYILIVAYGKSFLSEKVGEFTNWGIVLGVGVIIGSWALGLIYIYWANNVYDKEVDAIKEDLLKVKVQ